MAALDRFASRSGRRYLWLRLAVVALFAVGIGASLAAYSLVDAILWKPLRAPEADRLVRVFATDAKRSEVWNGQSVPSFEDYRREARSFSSVAAFTLRSPMHLAWGSGGDGPARRVEGAVVSGDYLSMLGVRAVLGRMLLASDDRGGAPAVAVLSNRSFRELFGGDPAWIGRVIRVNGLPVTLVGVAERGAHSVDADSAPAIWLPLSRAGEVMPHWASAKPLENRNFYWIGIVGRLAPGATLASAQAELDVIAGRRAAATAAGPEEPFAKLLPASAVTLGQDGGPGARRLAWILAGAAALVLLSACLNASSLLLAAIERREGDLAVRLALGASSQRLASAVVIESLTLAALGAGLGLLLALGLVNVAGSPIERLGLPVAASSPLQDLRALSGAVLLALGSGLLASWGPWRRAQRVSLRDRLQAASRTIASGSRARRGLVIAQVGLTAVLLFAAGLLFTTLRNVARIDLGFDPSPLAMASVELAAQGYDRARGGAFQAQLLAELAQDPAIESAALGTQWPLQSSTMRLTVKPEGYVFAPDEDESVGYVAVSPSYFSTLAVPLLAGREIGDEDRARGRQVAVVNQAFAGRFFAGLDPQRVIGRHVEFPGDDLVEIVGVSRDTKSRELRDSASPAIYVPIAQRYAHRVTVVARARTTAGSARQAIDRTLAQLDRDLPSYGARTATEQLRVAMARERALSSVLGSFSVLALVLAFSGVFGVLSFEVQARRRELGIRSALGAHGARLARGVVESALRLTAIGLLGAVAPAYFASRLLTAVLYGLAPTDPRAVLTVLVVVALAALAAAGGPARLAARTDPAKLLRAE